MVLANADVGPRLGSRLLRGVVLATATAVLACSMSSVSATSAQAGTKYLVVTSASWKRLQVRTGPGTGFAIVARLQRGTRVSVLCTEGEGSLVKGALGSSRVWDMIGKEPDGTEHWVSDQFLDTGTDEPVAPRCPSPVRVSTVREVRFEVDQHSCEARRAAAGRLVPWFKHGQPWNESWKGPLLQGACNVEDLVDQYVAPAVGGCIDGAILAQVKNAILTKTPAGIPSTAYSCVATGLAAVGITVVAVNAPLVRGR